MAISSKDLVVRFISDTSNWKKGYQQVRNDVQFFNNAEAGIASSTKKMNASINGVGNTLAGKGGLSSMLGKASTAVSSFLSTYGGIALAGGGALGAVIAIVAGIKKIITTGIQAETQITKLAVLLGNNRKAALETYEQVIEYAAQTPKTSAELMDALVIAQTYGFNAMKKGAVGIQGTIMQLATGMSAITGQSMSDAMTTLMRADLALLDKYGGTARKAYEEAKKVGQQGTDAFRIKFIQEMAKVPEYMRAAAAESQTMKGLWSTIMDNVGLVFLYLSGATSDDTMSFWEALKRAVKQVSDWIMVAVKEAKPFLIQYGKYLGTIFETVWALLKASFTILKPFLGLTFLLAQGFMHILMPILKVLTIAFDALTKMLNALYSGLTSTKWFIDMVKNVAIFVESFFIKSQMLGVFLKKVWDAMLESLLNLFKKLPDLLGQATDYVSNLFSDAGNAVSDFVVGKQGDRTVVGNIIDWATGKDKSVMDGYQAPTSNKTVNNNRTSIDNSSTTTNIMNRMPTAPDYLIKNPFDMTGRPAMSGGW